MMSRKPYNVTLPGFTVRSCSINIDSQDKDFKGVARDLAGLLYHGVPNKAMRIILERVARASGYDDDSVDDFINGVWETLYNIATEDDHV